MTRAPKPPRDPREAKPPPRSRPAPRGKVNPDAENLFPVEEEVQQGDLSPEEARRLLDDVNRELDA